MRLNRRLGIRAILLALLIASLTLLATRNQADTASCGGQLISVPFTDVAGSIFFCPIAEAYFSGLTNGTTPTTYSPGQSVPREQMAAFITRTMDQSLRRGSRRAALDQWWTPATGADIATTTVTTAGGAPQLVQTDGADVWVASFSGRSVTRVRASDGRVLETIDVSTFPLGVRVAKAHVFVTGRTVDGTGELIQIDPSQSPAAATTLSSTLGVSPNGLAFDGTRIWTANVGAPGSVSIVTLNPVSVATVTTGFSAPRGILYDGSNIWVTDLGDNSLKKLDANCTVVQTVPVGGCPRHPIFDGTNIWVPNQCSNTVTVVRAATGQVLATLSGNGLDQPAAVAFDGERILVTDLSPTVDAVSLWRASDLTPLGFVLTGSGTGPYGACSDGLNFWIAFNGTGQLARF